MKIFGYDAVLDPTGHFGERGAKRERLLEACGILPQFFMDATKDPSEPTTAAEVLDDMTRIYGFGDFRDAFKNGYVSPEGVYSSEYEEDPPLYPLLSMKRDMDGQEVEMLVYQYAMLCIRDKERAHITRMD